ncbi:pro-neuregulin-1, membrane-bound isoform isoform X2 [Stigmatopora nigra]
MTEGIEDPSPPGSASPCRGEDVLAAGHVPEEEEKPEESGGDGEERTAAEAAATEEEGGDGEHPAALGVMALPAAATCCVCVEMERVNNCLHSEKICILPILACLLSLALCTAGLKWVFADKIFQYQAPTHSGPKRIGQDPVLVLPDPTLASPHSSPSTLPWPRPEVLVEDKSTRGSYVASRGSPSPPPSPVTSRPAVEVPGVPGTTRETNDIVISTIASSSTSTTTKTSSHVTRCSDSQKNYCVNGGECFTLEIMPGSTKFLCRCPNEFTGDRCQSYVMASFYTEELYQKRILTITGICIALLVVGIMCVVAYCKTKKQRKKLHDRLRQNLRSKRNKVSKSASRRQVSNLPLQDLQHANPRNGTAIRDGGEKEAESTFSASNDALSTQQPTMLTHVSSQRHPSAEKAPPQPSPVPCSSSPAATPGSPPSETSATLSSQATSVPSLSPWAEEQRPLILSKTQRPPDEAKRTSAHYNHGLEAHSLPPSPLRSADNRNRRSVSAARHAISASTEKLVNANNVINHYGVVANGHGPRAKEFSIENVAAGDAEDPKGDRTPFISIENAKALLLRAKDGSRTTAASLNADPPALSPAANV